MTTHRLLGHARIYRALLGADDRVLAVAWQAARVAGEFVGTCGRCGNPMRPLAPYRVGRIGWYPSECTAEGCDYQASARGPAPEMATTKGARRP